MVGADVPVIQALRLFGGIRQNAFALIRKRQIDGGRNFFTNRGPALDLFADTFDGGVISQEAVGQVLVFADQSQKQMLGFNGGASELAGFIASEEDDPPCSLSISFEHKFDSQMPVSG